MTPEEKEEIVLEVLRRVGDEIRDAAVEKALLCIPEVVTHLFQQRSVMAEMVKKFYSDNPSFVDHKDVVAQCIEREDADAPGTPYEELLKRAKPKIEKVIATKLKLDTTSWPKPTPEQLKPNSQGQDLGEL